jgi:hypothetical protein
MGFRTSAASVATILIVFSLAHAQPASQPTIAIRAGRLIDVRTGRVSQNTFIIVAKEWCEFPILPPPVSRRDIK